MAEAISMSTPISGTDKTLMFETGKLAFQSQGSVVGRIGNTVVLATANAAKGVREGIDFFPLTVDVEERMYAAGRIPGSFFRREGRPTDIAILNARLIDRTLRPLFAAGFRNETQVVVHILGADQQNPPDVLGINAASAALMLSGIPFNGPIGAVRLAYSAEGSWLAHPSFSEGDEGTFEMVVTGRETAEGEVAIMMVEAGGTENAWSIYESGAPKVTEAVVADGIEAAKTWIKESIDLQRQLIDKAGVHEPIEWTPVLDFGDDIFDRVAEVGRDRLAEAAAISLKSERNAATDAAASALVAELSAEFPDAERQIASAVRAMNKKLVRKRIVEEGVRIDGRGPRDIRPLSAEVGVLPTAHGSGLFQRGETQVLDVCTLGMPRMDQLLDNLAPGEKKRFMHHYNMPPLANGEVGRMGSPKRREIGHGLLAERALLPVVPSADEFPYALRLVSEVLSSNGSTSMGSVCASTLSLMDAGVPVKAPVAGIAMGLIHHEGSYVTLTDILGAEDAFGDMDFKVAGTAEFVTALQLDTKIDGLPAEVLAQALEQAKEARLQILDVMHEAISTPREQVGENAPKIVSFEIPLDKIGEVIGPKGKVINAIQQETLADINVDDDGRVGKVTIGSTDSGAVDEARRQIELILDPPTAEVGQVYPGKVVNITKFGAFVNILPGRDGLVHISKLGSGRRIERVEDVLSLGQEIEVRVDDIDPQGKVSLSPVTELTGNGSGGSGGGGGGGVEGSAEAMSSGGPGREYVSFEDSFDAELREEFGELGPDRDSRQPARRGAGEGDSRGGGSGSGGGDRRRRRRR
jgi:polyribonucleotide nucleotidyltransferase